MTNRAMQGSELNPAAQGQVMDTLGGKYLAGGEGYDWFYASDDDRAAGIRSSITDGLNKPWVFRYKDLVSWWSLPRNGGAHVSIMLRASACRRGRRAAQGRAVPRRPGGARRWR